MSTVCANEVLLIFGAQVFFVSSRQELDPPVSVYNKAETHELEIRTAAHGCWPR